MAEITRNEYEKTLEKLDKRLKRINIFDIDPTGTIEEELIQIAEEKDWIEGCYIRSGKTVYCTVNAFDCPYYNCGRCGIEDPVKDCEDFNTFFESWEDWEEC